MHWLQTDAPRPDGGTGYPGLRLCPEVLGTQDGLAAEAYVRESRRIAAEFTVLETHVGVEARPGADRAEAFPTRSASAATGSTCIRARPDAATSTSRPTRSRSRWALCSRSDWTTCWPPANAWGSPISPMAATGSTRWNGTSARRPAPWPRSALSIESARGPCAAHPDLLADFQRTLHLDGCPAALARGDPDQSAMSHSAVYREYVTPLRKPCVWSSVSLGSSKPSGNSRRPRPCTTG